MTLSTLTEDSLTWGPASPDPTSRQETDMFDPRRFSGQRLAVLSACVAVLLAATLTPVAGAATPTATGRHRHHVLPYRNRHLPVARRVADLLGRMTLQEKVGQM